MGGGGSNYEPFERKFHRDTEGNKQITSAAKDQPSICQPATIKYYHYNIKYKKYIQKKIPAGDRRRIPHIWYLFFLFSTSVYIRRKRRNVGIENIPDIINLRTGIVDDIKAGK